MCHIEDCTRHELWGGLCRDHLVEKFNPKPKRTRKKAAVKKIDAEEVLTMDADETETRKEDNE